MIRLSGLKCVLLTFVSVGSGVYYDPFLAQAAQQAAHMQATASLQMNPVSVK